MKKILIFLLMLLMLLMSCKDNNDEKNTTSDKENKGENFAIFDSSAESYNAGNYDEAIQKLSKIIESSKDDAKAYMHRGEAYLAKSTTDAEILLLAKADFEQALVFDPTLSHAKECLAYIFYLQGDTVAARNLILEFFESSSESTYTFVLFVISDKYCPECGRFEHTQHPEVWLSDMSDEELVEKVKPYVELYYDCMWRLDFRTSPYGAETEAGYMLLKKAHSSDMNLVRGRYKNSAGVIDFSNDDFEHHRPIGAEETFEGTLYDINGKDVTDLYFNSSRSSLFKITNFSSLNKIMDNYKQFFSTSISSRIDDYFKEDTAEGELLEFNGELFCIDHTSAARGALSPAIEYDSAVIMSRDENSCVVKYKHDDFMITITESTWTFGVENGKFVLINYEETHRDQSF